MIILGGILHVLIGVFHLYFEKLFGYNSEIKQLSFINQRIALFLNIILTSFLFGIGILSISFHGEFTSTQLGIYLSFLLAAVWFFRAILQVMYFPLNNLRSFILLIIFILISICYSVNIDFIKYCFTSSP